MNRKRPEATVRSGELALTGDELARVVDCLDHPRDKALVALAVSGGLRREDVVSVRVTELDVDDGRVGFNEKKKGGRPRTIWIGGRALRELRAWLAVRPRGGPWVFPGRPGRRSHLSSREAYNVFQSGLRTAGLDPRPFHTLRATGIKLALRRGWDVTQVAAHAGDTVRTIQRHYDVPSKGEIAELARVRPVW